MKDRRSGIPRVVTIDVFTPRSRLPNPGDAVIGAVDGMETTALLFTVERDWIDVCRIYPGGFHKRYDSREVSYWHYPVLLVNEGEIR